MKLEIENTSWSIQKLSDNLGNIIKPIFQRKSKWTIVPHNTKKGPSYLEYIKFLYKTKNSVDPISFGTLVINNNINYINIDGNNRINAIITFINRPLIVFEKEYSEYLDKLKFNKKIYNIVLNLSYNTLGTFRRINQISEFKDILHELNDCNKRDLVEDILCDLQDKLLFNDNKLFTECVILNINIFKNGTYEQYNEIFSSINKHSNELSDNELLASILFSSYINLPDNEITFNIKQEIKKYYSERDEGEILQNDYKINDNKINAFDFMIGTQNYYFKITNGIISKYDAKGLGLMFKIYKTIYKKDNITENSFEDFDAEKFLNNIDIMAKILLNINNKICNKNINDKIFGISNNINKLLKKNNQYIVCISILSCLKHKTNNENIINNISKAIIYHILCKFLPKNIDEEYLNKLKDYDKLKYEAGGGFIDNVCWNIYNKNPELIYIKLNKKLFQDLLNILFSRYNNEIFLDKKRRRRKLNIIHKIIYTFIHRSLLPSMFLKEQYSIEHLIPFSTNYDNKIDIDRIGNLIPIPLDYNIKRGNKTIRTYKEIDKSFYKSFIRNICSYDDYNNIIEYQKDKSNRDKPYMISNEGYTKLCEKNEKMYIDIIINDLFQ
jgi:hypothetical protein